MFLLTPHEVCNPCFTFGDLFGISRSNNLFMSMLLVTTAQPYNLVTLSVPCLLLSYDNFSILFIIFVCMGVCLHIRL